ncbi:MAG: hypothetical protein K8R36_05430 [Planctomycetales bacterium]|nr:hypothetical protein [Planctomycetales bacterium]
MAFAAVASRPVSSRLPLWLSRFHSWWFALQVLANLVAAWFIIKLVSGMDWSELGLGLLLGQGFLLSAWLALGGLPNVLRFASVFLVTLIAALGLSDHGQSFGGWEEWVDQTSQIFIICFFAVLVFHAALLPLRWLLGWRLDFDPAYHRRENTGRLQVGVVHFFGLTTFVAIPCAIIRLMPPDDAADVGVVCLMFVAMTFPLAATVTLAIVGKRRWWWALGTVAAFGILCTVQHFIPSLIFEEDYLHFNFGIIAAVAGNLLVLRCFGLKLFSVIEQTVPASGEREFAENPVQPPHFHLQPARQWSKANSGS